VQGDDVRADSIALELELVDLFVPIQYLSSNFRIPLRERIQGVRDRALDGRPQTQDRLLETLLLFFEMSFGSIQWSPDDPAPSGPAGGASMPLGSGVLLVSLCAAYVRAANRIAR